MTPHETVAILDFGGQYTQLIARRVRENHVYSEVFAPNTPAATLSACGVKGIILSGGPASVYERDAPRCDAEIFELGVPVLGICYGMQISCEILGGKVQAGEAREFGRVKLHVENAGRDDRRDILGHLPAETTVWMSHGDIVTRVSDDFE